MKLDFRMRLLATTLIVSAGAIASPAFAQEVPPTPETPSGPVEGQPVPSVSASGEPVEQAQDIVVTGSRIARPNVESSSPVTVVGSQQIEQQGTTRIEDALNSLPQVTPGQTAFVSNGATGTATVNLRGLGTTRTLVLVNGRRLQPGSPFAPVADLNQIPASLVKRIEVLTGGASSTYGADAVAGVVNFIMDTDFKGFQLDSTYGIYQHQNRNDQIIDSVGGTDFTIRDRLDARGFGYPTGNVVDGATWDTTATIGASFDDGRGSVVAYAGYRQVKPILQGRRDHSSCALSLGGNGRITCGGSFTAPNATIVDPTFGNFFFGVAGGSEDFSDFGATGSPPYNYAPINYFQRPDKRWTAGAYANYEISDAVKPYMEFMFMDDRSVAQIAESGTFFADTYNIRCDSPLLTPTQGATLCDAIDGQVDAGDDPVPDGVVPLLIGKRNAEGGGRQADLRHTGYRAVVGSRGDITDRFSYDVSGQYGTTIFSQTYLNDFSRRRLFLALDAVVDPATGQVVCAVNADANPSNNDAACVPYNPFQGAGITTDPRTGITQGALGYVSTPGLQRGDLKEYVANAYVTGQLFNLMSSEPVSVVAGAEYRKEMLQLQSDVAFETGDLAGQGGPSLSLKNKFDVKELFTEVLVPIVADRPFFYRLALEAGYRYSDYSLGFSTDTYKIAGEWSPIREVKIRGGYNRAVRAPNILELFTPTQIALFSGDDPCAGATPQFTPEQCARTGVRPGQYGRIAASPADQYNQLIGGNPNVTPEKADTITAGLVIEPRRILPGFVATVDYYNIKIKNAVSSIGAQTILDQCGLTGNALFCGLITRDPVSGNLFSGQEGFVTNLTQNIGGVKTSGIDVGASYFREIGPGRANFDLQGTYLLKSEFDTGIPTANSDGVYDCVGFTGSICGFPTPKWRHTARFGYTMGNGIGLSLRWRHIGKVRLDEFSSDVDLGETDPDARGNIKAHNYFDLTTTFNVTEKFRWLIGVNNLLDKDPPLRATSFGTDNANTWAGTYDPVGRYLFVSGTLRF